MTVNDLLLCSTEEFYSFGTIWRWANDDRMFIIYYHIFLAKL